VLTGYSPDLLFTWAVESINGVENYSSRGLAAHQHIADPEFFEFVSLLAELQDSGAIRFEIDRSQIPQHPFHVRTSQEQPEDAYASFHYQEDWYWIAHDDHDTKRVFTLMLFLTTLTNRQGTVAAPLLTIPTQ
jgi:hypothetical protein